MRGLGNSPFGSCRVPRHRDLKAAGAEEMGKATGKFYNWEKRNVHRRGSVVWLWGPRETGGLGCRENSKEKPAGSQQHIRESSSETSPTSSAVLRTPEL